jgi:hypothetical protein
LRAKGVISERRYEELRKKLEVGVLPDAVLNVRYRGRGNTLEIVAQPQSKETYNAIVGRLLEARLVESEDLTADEVKNAYISPRRSRRAGGQAI